MFLLFYLPELVDFPVVNGILKYKCLSKNGKYASNKSLKKLAAVEKQPRWEVVGMTEKELKKLNRYQLLELLVVQTARADELQKQLDQAQSQLDSKEIDMVAIGSIAEASVQVGGLFEAAQNTVEIYLQSARKRIQEMEADAAAKAARIIADATEEASRIIERAKLEFDDYSEWMN